MKMTAIWLHLRKKMIIFFAMDCKFTISPKSYLFFLRYVTQYNVLLSPGSFEGYFVPDVKGVVSHDVTLHCVTSLDFQCSPPGISQDPRWRKFQNFKIFYKIRNFSVKLWATIKCVSVSQVPRFTQAKFTLLCLGCPIAPTRYAWLSICLSVRLSNCLSARPCIHAPGWTENHLYDTKNMDLPQKNL